MRGGIEKSRAVEICKSGRAQPESAVFSLGYWMKNNHGLLVAKKLDLVRFHDILPLY